LPSDNSGEETPVPIPNTEVKLSSADGSWGQRPCKSRSSLGRIKRSMSSLRKTCFFFASFAYVSLTLCKNDVDVSFLAKEGIL
jgi:hypothetical protein